MGDMWPKRSSSPSIQEKATALAMNPVIHPQRNARRGVGAARATSIWGTSATHMSGQRPTVGTDTQSSAADSSDSPSRRPVARDGPFSIRSPHTAEAGPRAARSTAGG